MQIRHSNSVDMANPRCSTMLLPISGSMLIETCSEGEKTDPMCRTFKIGLSTADFQTNCVFKLNNILQEQTLLVWKLAYSVA